MHKRQKIQGRLCAALLTFLLLFTGCAAQDKTAASHNASADSGEAGGSFTEETESIAEDTATDNAAGIETAGDASGVLDENRKIIRTAYLDAETTEFDETAAAIEKCVAEAGGYIASRSVSMRDGQYGEYTCRIPADGYDAFLTAVSGSANITHREEGTEDVTEQYVDIEARLKSLEAQQERLYTLLETAGDLENLIAVQNQLTEVQYQLEAYAGKQRVLQNQVAYATVTVSLSEVVTYTPVEPDFGARIQNAFFDMCSTVQNGAEQLVIFSVYLLPVFALVLAAGIIALIFVLRAKRRHKRK